MAGHRQRTLAGTWLQKKTEKEAVGGLACQLKESGLPEALGSRLKQILGRSFLHLR